MRPKTNWAPTNAHLMLIVLVKEHAAPSNGAKVIPCVPETKETKRLC